MVEYRRSRDAITSDKVKSRAGLTFSIVALFLTLLFGLLFVSGFWNERPVHAGTPPPVQQASPGKPA
jgi:hypothetical protein